MEEENQSAATVLKGLALVSSSRDSRYEESPSPSSSSPAAIVSRKQLLWSRAKPYLAGLALRLSTLIAIIAILIGIGLGLRYNDNVPQPENFSDLTFDWHVDPSSYLQPFNASFQYNVLLDGHSHSNFSDGRMNVRQLLEWHIGKYVGKRDKK